MLTRGLLLIYRHVTRNPAERAAPDRVCNVLLSLAILFWIEESDQTADHSGVKRTGRGEQVEESRGAIPRRPKRSNNEL